MTPEEFHDQVAQPNMEHALRYPGDARALVNAVLSLDALAGILHAHGRATGVQPLARHTAVADSYRMLKRIVDGGQAELDEGDHFTRAGEP